MKAVSSLSFFVLVAAGYAASSPRTTVSFNLGWRFYYGAPSEGGQCTAAFGLNYTNQQCDGLSNVASAASVEDCESACCEDGNCQIYQWLGSGQPGGGCWIGSVPSSGCNQGGGWISYANTTRQGVPFWANVSYDDNAWSVEDAPHDFIITGPNASTSPFNQTSGNQGQAFIPKSVGAYRKHFSLPASWAGTHIEIYAESMYASAVYYLNGQLLGSHVLGYTSFFTRLDNVTGGLQYGAGTENVLAVFVDATESADTGWWYEGGGASRNIFISSTSPSAHIIPHGLWADASLTGGFTYPSIPADGVTVATASLLVFVELETDAAVNGSFNVALALFASDGVTVAATGSISNVLITPGSTTTASAMLTLSDAECWSVARPYLYTLQATVQGTSDAVLDQVNVTTGLRAVRFDADSGVFLNEQNVKMRGYCDHESYTAVGMAVPARINLFRFQSMRGMGGQSRRYSHNPPAPTLLDLADRLGIMTLDENRVFLPGLGGNMADLVDRDRIHPSVIFWSFCNEPGCNFPNRTAPAQPTQEFKGEVEVHDGTRAVTGNMCVGWGSCPPLESFLTGLEMSFALDVQGFSHVDATTFEAYHDRWPLKPLTASECCSCETQRGVDNDIPYNKTLVYYSDFNADCIAQQTNWSLGLEYVGSAFVWTNMDYWGEPDAWPHVSSSFGSYDLSGFPKAAVWWYRSWWLANTSLSSPDRPPIPSAISANFAYIVENWRSNPASPGSNRTIHVYTNAAYTFLALNGAPVGGGAVEIAYLGYATFSVAFAPGTLTATALAADGTTVLATASKSSWGAPAAIVISLDSPSPASGTGGALYLDGGDAALVRATIVDAQGNVCGDASTSVSFVVSSGPGMIWGTGNGDPANQNPPHAPSVAAYNGLARAVIRVTQASAVATPAGDGGAEAVALLASVNIDAGKGPRSSSIVIIPAGTPTTPIVISASSPGMATVSVSIPTSVQYSDSVLEVAANNVANAYIGY